MKRSEQITNCSTTMEQQMQTDPAFAERVKEITTNINNKR